MKLTKNQFYGKAEDLPRLPQGSTYVAVDTGQIFAYGSQGDPIAIGGGDGSGGGSVLWSQIIGKPVFFSGSYNDLSGTPALFSGNYNDLTNKPAIPNGTTISQQTLYYSTLTNGTSVGDLAYVEDSEGTAWLPGSIGGSYYPKGIYYWNGSAWASDRNAIANQIELNKNVKADWNETDSSSDAFIQNKPTISGGGGSALTIADEGSDLATAADKLDFVGSAVTVTGTGTTKTITISGAGGGFSGDYADLTNKPNVNDLSVNGDLDLAANKVLFSNVYSNLVDLPAAASYHGMFAHVHATGQAYYAHDGSWVELAKNSDIGGGSSTPPVPLRLSAAEVNKNNAVAYISMIGQSNGDGTQVMAGGDQINTPLTNVFHLTRATAISGGNWSDESTWGWTGFTTNSNVNNLGVSKNGHYTNQTTEIAREWQSRIDNGDNLPDLYLTHMSYTSQGFGNSNNNQRFSPIGNQPGSRDNIWTGSLKIHKWALNNLIDNELGVIHLGVHNNQWEHDGYLVTEGTAYQSWIESLLAEHDKIAGIKLPFTHLVPSTDGFDGRFLGRAAVQQSLENITGRNKIALDPLILPGYNPAATGATGYLGIYHDDVHYNLTSHAGIKDQWFTKKGYEGRLITSAAPQGGGGFSGDYNDLTNIPTSVFDDTLYDLSTVVDNKIALVSSITKWQANKYESAATNLALPGITYNTVNTPAAGWQSLYESNGKKYFRLNGRGTEYSFLNFSGLPTDTSFGSVIMRIKAGSRISIGIAFSMNDLSGTTFQNSGKEYLGLAFYADSGNTNVTNQTTCNTQAWSMNSGVTLLDSQTVTSSALAVGAGTTGATDDIDLKFSCLPGSFATGYNFVMSYKLTTDTAYTTISTLTDVGVGATSANVQSGGGIGILSGLGDKNNSDMIDSMRFQSFEIISEE